MEKKERIELSNRLVLEFGATGDNDITFISCKLGKLLDILEQELDKARREGYIDCLKEIIKLGTHFKESTDIRRLSGALKIRLEDLILKGDR